MQAPTHGGSAVRQSPAPAGAPSGRRPRATDQSASAVLLSSPEAAQVFGVSLRTFQAMREKEWFTVRPRNLGPKTVRWVRAELEALATAIPASEPLKQPDPLRERIERLKRGPKPDSSQAATSATPNPAKPSPGLAAVSA